MDSGRQARGQTVTLTHQVSILASLPFPSHLQICPSVGMSQAPKILGERIITMVPSPWSPIPETHWGSTYLWWVTLDICLALIHPDLSLN